MSPARWLCVPGGLVLVAFSAPAAFSASIDHKAVACVVADRFPRLEARLDPVDAVGRARVFFRTEGTPAWYAVAMKREGDVFAAALPKPKKDLKRFRYYVEMADTSMATSRTEEYLTEVVSGGGGCSKGMMASALSTVASILLEVPLGAAAIPAGFSSAGVVAAAAGSTAAAAGGSAAASSGGGGLGTAAIVGGVGAVAAAGAIVAVKASDDGGSTVRISGQVSGRGPNDPVVGGVVSTSLDSATATTDGQGRFELVTTTVLKRNECRNYTITITASGLPTYSLTANWGGGPSDQRFNLIPPQPSSIQSCP